jgi:anti-sigma factor RsiW
VTNEELTCKELVELVTDYLEGHLAPMDRSRFEEHISACPGCIHYLQQMQSTLKALAATPSPELPDEIQSALMTAFRNWKRTDPR